jgi:hypothetical protein
MERGTCVTGSISAFRVVFIVFFRRRSHVDRDMPSAAHGLVRERLLLR